MGMGAGTIEEGIYPPGYRLPRMEDLPPPPGEEPVFRTGVEARHYDWGLWLLAILAAAFLLKRL